MKSRFILFCFLTCVIIAGCNSDTRNSEVARASVADSTKPSSSKSVSDSLLTTTIVSATPDYNVLTGDWVRTDGGYIISIKSITAEGTLNVEYYNPKPINVGKSAWETDGNNLYLMVELRDVNYPGSTYTLQYFPTQDKLAGNYFQAVEGSNFEVVFDRKK